MNLRISDRILLGLFLASEIRAYPVSRLFFWTPPGYSRKKFRHLVRRLVKNGLLAQLIIGGEVQVRLKTPGHDRLLKTFPVLKNLGKIWDGFYRLIIFDIPEAKRRQRNELRRLLVKMGLGRLQDSTYISSFDWEQWFIDWLQAKGLFGSVLLLEAKQKYLGNPKNMAAKVWQLDRLNQEYLKVNERLTTRMGISDARKRLDFLRKTYQDYLTCRLADPLLPPELLPTSWPEAKSRQFILQAGVVKE